MECQKINIFLYIAINGLIWFVSECLIIELNLKKKIFSDQKICKIYLLILNLSKKKINFLYNSTNFFIKFINNRKVYA